MSVGKKRVAILISGRGTNMARLIEAAADPLYPAEIVASMHGDAERFPASEMGKAIRVLYEALRETAGGR